MRASARAAALLLMCARAQLVDLDRLLDEEAQQERPVHLPHERRVTEAHEAAVAVHREEGAPAGRIGGRDAALARGANLQPRIRARVDASKPSPGRPSHPDTPHHRVARRRLQAIPWQILAPMHPITELRQASPSLLRMFGSARCA